MLPIATPIIDDDCKDSEPIQPEDADLELPQICQSVNPSMFLDVIFSKIKKKIKKIINEIKRKKFSSRLKHKQITFVI